MLPKQDRVRPRTPSDLEHKYNLGEFQIAADGSLYRLIDADGSLYRLFEGEKEYLNMIPGKWAKVYDSENKPTIEEIGAAPNGYGLGANAGIVVSDLNTCVRNGWYHTDWESTNVPYRSYFCYATVFVTARTSKIIVQRLIAPETGSSHAEMLRYTEDGGATWVDEWVNPPMVSGEEYRTTERYGGNPVYTKLINCGQNTHGKKVPLEYPNVIRYAARATNGVAYPFAESTSNYHRRVQISQQEIMIIAGKAAENADTVYCQIWYTK